MQGDYIAGSKVAFFRDADGQVEWMRFGGRIYKREPADADPRFGVWVGT